MIQWEVPPSRRMAFVAVLLVMVVSVLATVLVGFRVGGYLLAASLALAALFRGLLPAKYCLGLLVRTRRTDVVLACALAVSIAFLAATVPG